MGRGEELRKGLRKREQKHDREVKHENRDGR